MVVGAAGASAFALLGLPLPFLLGPIFAVTLAALAGFAGHVPAGLRNVVIGVLGVFVGAGFSTERLAGLVHWLPSAVGLLLCVPAAAAHICGCGGWWGFAAVTPSSRPCRAASPRW